MGVVAGVGAEMLGATEVGLLGTSTSFARPMSLFEEVLRIRVLTARAAAPIARTNSTATATATFDLMSSP